MTTRQKPLYCKIKGWCALPRGHAGTCLTQVERDFPAKPSPESETEAEAQLPGDIVTALNESQGAAVMASRFPEYRTRADAARAALTAAIMKYAADERAEGMKWMEEHCLD